jgi:mRNA interferase RelE/StbE
MRSSKYEVRIKKSAAKEMDRLPTVLHKRISTTILSFENDPRPRLAIRLRGSDVFRVRSGDYRILYTIDDRLHVVHVLAVGHRREVYRNM